MLMSGSRRGKERRRVEAAVDGGISLFVRKRHAIVESVGGQASSCSVQAAGQSSELRRESSAMDMEGG